MAVNPFLWTGAITDGVARGDFGVHTALMLKGGTHVALFGPRGTGKTTFLSELEAVLSREQEADAPPWDMVVVDLRRAISVPAFIGAVHDAMANHPSRQLRRRAKAAIASLEKQIGVNLGVVKVGLKSGARKHAANEPEVLHAQLLALASISDRLVIAFDEFQRLANCPGEPLSIIRSALMGPGHTGRLTLLLTGSLRERLRLMLHTSTEPIWDQTHDVDLPPLDRARFTEYLELKFEASGKPIDERAVEHLLELTNGHPKRTQHLAWYVWDAAEPGGAISSADVQEAFESLLASGKDNTDFAKVVDTLLSGNDQEQNEARTLFIVANGAPVTSDKTAQLYGLTNESATRRSLARLEGKGIIDGHGSSWSVVDPLLAAWLRRNDPVATG